MKKFYVLLLIGLGSIVPALLDAQTTVRPDRTDIHLAPKVVDGKSVTIRRNYDLDGRVTEEFQAYDQPNGQYLRHGLYFVFHPNGTIKTKAEYRNGVLHGKGFAWFANGNQEYEIHYNMGTFHGIYRMWYENGKPHTEGTFLNNIRKGQWRAYDENGILSNEVFFD